MSRTPIPPVTDPRMIAPSGEVRRPPGRTVYDESDRFKCCFGMPSSDGTTEYIVSYDSASGWWTCNCRGGINHGKCRHMGEYNLPGRKAITDAIEQAEVEKIARQKLKEAGVTPMYFTRPMILRDRTFRPGDLCPPWIVAAEWARLVKEGILSARKPAQEPVRATKGAQSAPTVPQRPIAPQSAPQRFAPTPANARPLPTLSDAMLRAPVRRFARPDREV